MIIESVEQRSPEWFAMRCGVITMSRAKDLLTGGKGITREKYLRDVAIERITGKPIERFQSWQMLYGAEMEPFALEAYEKITGIEPAQPGFVFLDGSRRIGGSPDALATENERYGIVEIKCPQPREHLTIIESNGEIPKGYLPQIQGLMWLCESEWCDFVSYCPEFSPAPFLCNRIYRDQITISRIADEAERGVRFVDALVDRLGIDHSSIVEKLADINRRAIEHVEHLTVDPDKVEMTE